MIHIAICDDEAVFRQRVTACLAQYLDAHPDWRPAVCVHSCATLQALEALEAIDLLLLDTGFGDETCLPVAQTLRRRFPAMVLIFITSMTEYIPAGYELGAFRYLLKSQLEAWFAPYLDAAFARLYPVWQVVHGGERYSMNVAKIVCIEVQKRILVVHLQPHNGLGSEVSFYGSMQAAAGEAVLHDFLQVHRSFLVNPAHIARWDKTEITLTNDMRLTVNRLKADELKKQWLAWIGRQSWTQ